MTRAPAADAADAADRLPQMDDSAAATSSRAAPRPSTIVVISASVITNGGEMWSACAAQDARGDPVAERRGDDLVGQSAGPLPGAPA